MGFVLSLLRAVRGLTMRWSSGHGSERVDDLPGRLMAEAWPAYVHLDVGVWGKAAYEAFKRTAGRLRAVSVMGEDVDRCAEQAAPSASE